MDHVHKVCICLVQPTFWGVALKKLPIRVKPCQDFVQEFFRSTLPPLILLILRNSFPTKSDTHITLQSSCLTGITRWFFFFYGTGTYRSQKRESHLSRPDFGTGFFLGGGGQMVKWELSIKTTENCDQTTNWLFPVKRCFLIDAQGG